MLCRVDTRLTCFSRVEGDLLAYLKWLEPDTEHLASPVMASICNQAVTGVAYLAAKSVVHRDIAARNCLIGSSVDSTMGIVVKIADFGLGKFFGRALKDYYISNGGVLVYVAFFIFGAFWSFTSFSRLFKA